MNKSGVVLFLAALGMCWLAAGQDTVTLSPNVLNLIVGETHSIQALNSAGQPVTGLTWTSSDPTVVSLSTDDPPILSALAAGNVTITAGTATADVTVSAGALPLGTVLWSNPGNGSGVYSIVPAVPSPNGVADMFAFQEDNTVSAITSDGTTAWTVDLSYMWPVLPDFQGGLVALKSSPDGASIVKFDGITGQRSDFLASDGSSGGGPVGVAVHPDGTIFAMVSTDGQVSVVGLDPTTGAQKFSATLSVIPDAAWGPLTVAGDGYAYVPYGYRETFGDCNPCSADYAINHLMIMRVNSAGANDEFEVYSFRSPIYDLLPIYQPYMITNADQGTLITWGDAYRDDDGNDVGRQQMAITTGASASMVSAPVIAGQNGPIQPMLQAQDGSFVGTAWVGDDWTPYMVAFDQGGSVRWSVGGEQPQIATDDGGVIGKSGTIYDQSGTATGQIQNLAAYSWLGNSYEIGSTDQFLANMLHVAVGWWPFAGANPSGNSAAVKQPWFAPLRSCPGASTPCPLEAILSANQALKSLLQAPCPACTSWVFNKLAGTDQTSFLAFLSRPPRFWDGTRSYAPQNVAFCPSGAWNQSFGCDYSMFDTVHEFFTQDATRDAASQTPADKGKGMRVFFNPATGICNVLSVLNPQSGDQGVLNQAILFHEALHGYTGDSDLTLKSAFGTPNPWTDPSALITSYLKTNVIFAQGASACTN